MPAMTCPTNAHAANVRAGRAVAARMFLLMGLLLSLVVMMTTAACSAPSTPAAAPATPTASRAPTAAAATPTLPKPPGGAYTAALEAAQKELATRLGIPAADIRLVTAEPVDWPDTSLGCPQPGMAYAQVITPGFRLVLAAGQAIYEYHSDYAGHFATCK